MLLIRTDTNPPAIPGAPVAWRPWTVIPAKAFTRAKSRLAGAVAGHLRRELARSMLDGVLAACAECADLHGTLVATDGDDVAALGTRRGATVLRDDPTPNRTLASIIDRALSSARELGATHALVVMADLPVVRAHDLREMLATLRHADVVLAPDLQRRGTSALGVRLDLGLHTWFGHDHSLDRHVQEAARLGATTAVVHNPRIAFDLDRMADWERAGIRL